MFIAKLRNLITPLRNEKGASAVEFALLALPLMLLVFGIIYFGMIFHYYLVLTHAAREGVRHASLHESDNKTISAITSAAASLDKTKLVIEIKPTRTSGKGVDDRDPRPDGSMVEINLKYPVKVEVPLINKFFKLSPNWDDVQQTLNLETTAVMRIE